MAINYIKQSILIILLILFQVWVLNRICLFGYATPLLYTYIIIKLPINLNRNWVVLLAFFLGYNMDMFNYSSGIHAFATTVAGFSRYYLLRIFVPRDVNESESPSFDIQGRGLFIRYAGVFVGLHHVLLFVVEYFSYTNLITLLLRIVGSMVISILFIYATENLATIKSTKR